MQSFDLHRKRFLSSCIRLSLHKERSLAFVGALLAGGLFAPAHAFADVPPASYRQMDPNTSGSAPINKLLADAQKALAGGDVKLALIYLRNAVGAAPRNTAARVQLGTALLRAGDEKGAELELRQAGVPGDRSRQAGADPALSL